MSENKVRVGIAGVGLMGHGIASNIVKNGYPLAVLKHPGNRPEDDLVSGGAVLVESLAELAKASDVIILCVTGSPQVENILYQEKGLLTNLRPGTIVIDCSTSIPTSTVKIAADVEDAGCFFLDAPMTRTPKEAAEGRLNLIVGGEKSVYERVHTLLSCFAENIVYAGKIGTGHRLKLIHNFVSLGFTAVLSEAVAASRRAGVPSDILLEILEKGGGQGAILNRLKPYIVADDDSGFRFSLSNAHKDLTYYTQMASDAHDFQDIAVAIRQVFAKCLERNPEVTLPQIVSIIKDFGTH